MPSYLQPNENGLSIDDQRYIYALKTFLQTMAVLLTVFVGGMKIYYIYSIANI